MVLIAASPFLLSKMSKTTPSTFLRVELPAGIQLQVASQLVHYLYDGKVTLATDNVLQFARVAKLFKLDHLYHICEDFISRFHLDQSLIKVQVEDISISCTVPEDHKSIRTTHKVIDSMKGGPAKTSDSSERTDPAKIFGKKKMIQEVKEKQKVEQTIAEKSVLPMRSKTVTLPKVTSSPPTELHGDRKVNHMYGTRAASAARSGKSPKKALVRSKNISPVSIKVTNIKTPPKQIIVSSSDGNSVNNSSGGGNSVKKGKKVTDWEKLLASISSEENSDELCIDPDPLNIVTQSPSQPDQEGMEKEEEDLLVESLTEELADSDFDDPEFFHGKTKTKYSMTASVRKSALLKKSKRLQHKFLQ